MAEVLRTTGGHADYSALSEGDRVRVLSDILGRDAPALPPGGWSALTSETLALFQVEARLRVLPVRWMGIGLLLAVSVGAAAWLFGRPFLSSSFSYVDTPLIGAVPLASALLFDLGVFALVVGATVLMLIAIAHQSVRSHRVPSGRGPAGAVSPKAEVR